MIKSVRNDKSKHLFDETKNYRRGDGRLECRSERSLGKMEPHQVSKMVHYLRSLSRLFLYFVPYQDTTFTKEWDFSGSLSCPLYLGEEMNFIWGNM